MTGAVSWGFLKEKLFCRKTSHEFETRRMVVELCREIEEHLCRRVYYDHVSSVSRIGHMEHILTPKKFSQVHERNASAAFTVHFL